MIGGCERRLVATLELVARCAASPSFLASIYCRRFLHVLETRHALFVFYAPPLEDFTSLPPPMRPELLSPVETGRLLRILLAVMHVADAPPKDANSLELRATVLRSVCVFVRVVFDPVSTYTVDCSVREECRSVFKRRFFGKSVPVGVFVSSSGLVRASEIGYGYSNNAFDRIHMNYESE